MKLDVLNPSISKELRVKIENIIVRNPAQTYASGERMITIDDWDLQALLNFAYAEGRTNASLELCQKTSEIVLGLSEKQADDSRPGYLEKDA